MSTFDEAAQIRKRRGASNRATATHASVVFETSMGMLSMTVDELVAARARAADLLSITREASSADETLNERLLDASEAAAVLGIKASWLLTRAREKRIPHVRAGKYVRFSIAAVRKALDED
jgi:excisionase family DNA binding protein